MGRGEVSKIKGNIAEPLYSGLEYPGLTTPYCFIQAVTLKLISYITPPDKWRLLKPAPLKAASSKDYFSKN